MKTLSNRNTGIAAFAAVVIVGLTGLTLDRAHNAALPQGVIEIGTLETQMVGDLAIASLPACTAACISAAISLHSDSTSCCRRSR